MISTVILEIERLPVARRFVVQFVYRYDNMLDIVLTSQQERFARARRAPRQHTGHEPRRDAPPDDMDFPRGRMPPT